MSSTAPEPQRSDSLFDRVATSSVIRQILEGSLGPKDNDARFLLEPGRRDLPGVETMTRYDERDEVDLCMVGARTSRRRRHPPGRRRRHPPGGGGQDVLTIHRYPYLIGARMVSSSADSRPRPAPPQGRWVNTW